MYKYALLCAAVMLMSGVFADDSTSFSKDCFNISGTISFNITYKMADDKLNSYEVMLTNASTISKYNCDQTAGPVMAVINEGGSDLTIQFDINTNKTKVASMDPQHWGVSKMVYEYTLSPADVKTVGRRQATAIGSYFVTPINHTYSCSKQSVKLENVTIPGANGTSVDGEFMNFVETGLTIRVGPLLPDTTDYDYHYCKADQKVKDIVPIAVGVALAALVVIVLVAYLIGRRRTVAAGGYERV